MLDIMKIIRTERRRQGVSQVALANIAQVHSSSVSFWETYKFSPKFDAVVNMLDALGCEVIIRRKIDGKEYRGNICE